MEIVRFLGEYQYSVDDKGRLIIPSKYRQPLLEGLVITRGLDKNLAIYPLNGWDRLSEKIEGLPYADTRARLFRRLVFSGAVDLVPDKQGRINIPTYLLAYAQIDKEVVVAGANSFIELWSPVRWQAEREAMESDDTADQWANLGI